MKKLYHLGQKKRPYRKTQTVIGSLFLALVILGYFFPYLGFFIVFCMITGMVMAVQNGRKWCDVACPRGSFLDIFLARISTQKALPKWWYKYSFRLTIISILFTTLIIRLVQAWPAWDQMGFVFVRILTITTVVSIILSFFFRARAWCLVCPVGTFSGLIGGKKKTLKIDANSCIDCQKCEKVCPMGLAPYRDKEKGVLQSRDCIRCQTCVIACPKKSLYF